MGLEVLCEEAIGKIPKSYSKASLDPISFRKVIIDYLAFASADLSP